MEFNLKEWLGTGTEEGSELCQTCGLEFSVVLYPVVGRCGHSLCKDCYRYNVVNDFTQYGNLRKCPIPRCQVPGSFHREGIVKNLTFMHAIEKWENIETEIGRKLRCVSVDHHNEKVLLQNKIYALKKDHHNEKVLLGDQIDALKKEVAFLGLRARAEAENEVTLQIAHARDEDVSSQSSVASTRSLVAPKMRKQAKFLETPKHSTPPSTTEGRKRESLKPGDDDGTSLSSTSSVATTNSVRLAIQQRRERRRAALDRFRKQEPDESESENDDATDSSLSMDFIQGYSEQPVGP